MNLSVLLRCCVQVSRRCWCARIPPPSFTAPTTASSTSSRRSTEERTATSVPTWARQTVNRRNTSINETQRSVLLVYLTFLTLFFYCTVVGEALISLCCCIMTNKCIHLFRMLYCTTILPLVLCRHLHSRGRPPPGQKAVRQPSVLLRLRPPAGGPLPPGVQVPRHCLQLRTERWASCC